MIPLHKRPFEQVTILTGAGISAESGLVTFRDSGGLWEGSDPMEVASLPSLRANPRFVLDFYNQRRSQLSKVEPNEAHIAISELQNRFSGDVFLITQNVDDLHERAGSSQVCHMHGSLKKMTCEFCYEEMVALELFYRDSACPLCQKKGGLRPDVVFFGEMPKYLDEITDLLSKTDLFLAIGTSGVVYPAAGFVSEVNEYGGLTVEINKEKSENTHLFNIAYQGLATEEVPKFVEDLCNDS